MVQIKCGFEYYFRGRRVVPREVTERVFGREPQVILQDCETQGETRAYARHFREEATRVR